MRIKNIFSIIFLSIFVLFLLMLNGFETSILNNVIKEKIEKKIEGSKNKLISRIQSLQIIILVGRVLLQDRTLANNIITGIMRYALSIQTDKFDTPRYLRVI